MRGRGWRRGAITDEGAADGIRVRTTAVRNRVLVRCDIDVDDRGAGDDVLARCWLGTVSIFCPVCLGVDRVKALKAICRGVVIRVPISGTDVGPVASQRPSGDSFAAASHHLLAPLLRSQWIISCGFTQHTAAHQKLLALVRQTGERVRLLPGIAVLQ